MMAQRAETEENDPLGLVARSHPLRTSLSQEMHLRRLPRFAAPARLLQMVVLLDEAAGRAAHGQVAALQPPGDVALPIAANHALFGLGPLTGVWERHAEFATYGFLLEGAFSDPFDPDAFAAASSIVNTLPNRSARRWWR